jgi:hypothetical protein
LTETVRLAKARLRLSIALLSRLAEPKSSLSVVLGHTMAVVVQIRQAALRRSVAIGCLLFEDGDALLIERWRRATL